MHLNPNSMELGDYIQSSDLLHDVPVHDLNCLNHVNTLLAAYDMVLDHDTPHNRCELARLCAVVNHTSHCVVTVSCDTSLALLHISMPVTCLNVLPKILKLGPNIWPELRKYIHDDSVSISYTGTGTVGVEVVRKFKSQPLAVPNFLGMR